MNAQEVVKRLAEIGDWTSDKVWEQNPIAAEAQRVIITLLQKQRLKPHDCAGPAVTMESLAS